MNRVPITYGRVALILAIIVILASSTYSYSLSIPDTMGNYGSTTLTTYYIDVEVSHNNVTEPAPGAKVCMLVGIPNGPNTRWFCSMTDYNGRATLLINMRSNYTRLLSSANLNTEPALLEVFISTTLVNGDWEEFRALIPTQYVLNGFYLKENLGSTLCLSGYGCSDEEYIRDDEVYFDNVKLLFNDVEGVFVMPSNATPSWTLTTTVTTAPSVTTTVTSTLTKTVTSTVTSFVTRTMFGTKTRTEYVTVTTTVSATPVTSYVTRTITSTSVLTLTSTRTTFRTKTVSITSFLMTTLTSTVTSATTLLRTLSFTKSVTLTTTVPLTLVNTSTITVTKTLTGGAGLSRGPSTAAIVLSILIVAASIIALALSRR